MHVVHEKGKQVNRTEHSAQTPSAQTGLFVAPCVSRRAQGDPTSALASSSRARVLFFLVVALITATFIGSSASPVFADSAPPSLQLLSTIPEGYGNYGHNAVFVYPTRLFSEANLYVNGLDTKWRTEYSTSKSALESGSGTVTSSGETPGDENISFGALNGFTGSQYKMLHHLIPATQYYAQFVAENAAGKTVLPIEFITPPVLKPEVSHTFPEDSNTTFEGQATSPTTAILYAVLETNGAATQYNVGYSTEPSGPVTSCAKGSVSVAEDFADVEVTCTGLAPETTYYTHLIATNEKGTIDLTKIHANGFGEVSSFATPTDKPVTSSEAVRNVTALSAHAGGHVLPNHEETHWRFESATSMLGPWMPVPGGAGTISQAEAEALAEDVSVGVGVTLTGLSPATTYYVRLFAESAAGEGENPHGEPVSTETRGFESFETDAPPTASTLTVHAFEGESLRLIGTVDPNSELTSEEQTITIGGAPTGGTFTLTFDGQTTEPIAYNAPADGPGSVREALEALSAIGYHANIEGNPGGPYSVFFWEQLAKTAQPEIAADASGLTPSGTVTVAVTQEGGEGYDTREHFQYVSEQQFKDGSEWEQASSTPEVDVGSGTEAKFVTADLPALTPGETYRYRIVATSTFPENPVVDGQERTITVPAPLTPEPAASCPNEALRTGASANLPDCRGYEQLTPVDKEGARDLFTYGVAIQAGLAVGEDGEHAVLEAETDWGSGPAAGQGPYFFAREAGNRWRMTAASTQPETGVNRVHPDLFSPDLESLAFSSSFATSQVNESKEIEYKVGPPGGPYTVVANVPAAQGPQGNTNPDAGLVAASRDLSKLFFAVSDHTLLGSATGTKHGEDLYESSGGELRQVNVMGSSPGSTIGACGANIVKGKEEAGEVSSVHAVSSDGSRVFFEAVPGANCSEAKHLYMRMDGESTVDIGAYRFVAANSEGTKLLLERGDLETHEIFLYDVESATIKPLLTVHGQLLLEVSEDLSTIYFFSDEQLTSDTPAPSTGAFTSFLYRYDVPGEKLTFVDSVDHLEQMKVSSDGRYLYFEARTVGGVPGGHETQGYAPSEAYRYDSGESVIQCVACASTFDPEPKLLSVFGQVGGRGGMLDSRTGNPQELFASGDGDYVFFDTPSALVSSDVDGEVAPSVAPGTGAESPTFSVSSDVYEWRKPGVDGCAHLQGCVALITNGRGGYLNLFLGTDESGRDAFIYTSSELVPQDNDSAGDIYDARVGGGTQPPPPRPVECEGDACSTPASAPNDATPSSFTFSGAGNVLQQSPVKPVVKSKRPKPKRKKPKSKAGHRKQTKRKGRKAAMRHPNTVKRAKRTKS
jgi:hypothetical protein